jgi:hypothetical protein
MLNVLSKREKNKGQGPFLIFNEINLRGKVHFLLFNEIDVSSMLTKSSGYCKVQAFLNHQHLIFKKKKKKTI